MTYREQTAETIVARPLSSRGLDQRAARLAALDSYYEAVRAAVAAHRHGAAPRTLAALHAAAEHVRPASAVADA